MKNDRDVLKPGGDWGRLVSLILVAAVAALVSFFAQPSLHQSDDAVGIIVTVISVLAGFLMAIIAMVGRPVMKEEKTWRVAQVAKVTFRRRLSRLRMLFVVYLLTMIVAFALSLTTDFTPQTKRALEHTFLFLATASIAVSIRLPWSLSRIQSDEVDDFIKKKIDDTKGEAGQ